MNKNAPLRTSISPWPKRKARAMVIVIAIAMLMTSTPPTRVEAASGDLDTSFAVGGKVTTDFFHEGDFATAIAIQGDGKIVAAGGAFTGVTFTDFALIRYNIDGSLDASFGSGGKVTTDFGNAEVATAVAIQGDGKIVAAGRTFNISTGTLDFALARYNSDGSLDATFGAGGKVTTDFSSFDEVKAMAIQGDGKIVVAGTSLNPGTGLDFTLARYNSDGSLDATFGTGGKVTTDFFHNNDLAWAVVIQGDGKIVAAGEAVPTLFSDFALARYNSDGSLDATFGAGGKVTTDFFGSVDEAFGVAIQGDGKIVAVGRAPAPVTIDNFGLARYNIDGSLDATFGSGGKVVTDFFGGPDFANAVAIQGDGKIVAAGSASSSGTREDFALARYNVSSFDRCLQAELGGNIFMLNLASGDYLFTNCSGLTLSGRGRITIKGSIITLEDFRADRRVVAKLDGSAQRGTAVVQLFSPLRTFTITDRNTANNSCSCQ